MSTSRIDTSVKSEAAELDEAFLRRVDQAMLLSKQRDPYRMDQVHRALEVEVQLAAFGDQEGDRVPRHDGPKR